MSNVVYKYPLRISKTNAEILRGWACTCRYLWNRTLRLKNYLYKRYKIDMGYMGEHSMSKRLTTLRNRYNWIKAVPCGVEQTTLRDLEKAFKNAFGRLKKGDIAGFPKFKKRGILPRLHFTKQLFNISIDNEGRHYLFLTKLKQPIRIDINRPFLNDPLDNVISCSVVYENGFWFICILVNTPDKNYTIKNTNPAVGIDCGIAKTYTLSDGKIYQIDNEKIKSIEDRIKILQKRLSRKVGSKKFEKHSNRYKKLETNINNLQGRLAGIRKDFNHKTSKDIINNYGIIALEKLKIANMSKSSKGTIEEPGKMVAQKSGLNKAILRNSWGQFRMFLEYKAKWNNVEVLLVNPAYTSQKCSKCKKISKDNRESQSKFVCKSCGYSNNADINAAINIKNIALKL